MSAKAIYESDGKTLLSKYLVNGSYVKNRFVVISKDSNWDDLMAENPWLKKEVMFCVTFCGYCMTGVTRLVSYDIS